MDGNIVIALLSSSVVGAIVAGIFSIINRRLDRRDKNDQVKIDLASIKEQLARSEKDTLRTQLLLLLSDYPEEHSEILKIAEHYFRDLKGNWYLTSIFNRWLTENDIAKPEWFMQRGE